MAHIDRNRGGAIHHVDPAGRERSKSYAQGSPFGAVPLCMAWWFSRRNARSTRDSGPGPQTMIRSTARPSSGTNRTPGGRSMDS